MSFRSLYDSPLVETALPCVVAAVVLALSLRKRGLVRAYGAVFSVGIAADAYLNGGWSPVKSGTGWATAVGVFFVIFGDFRYFVVLEESLPHALKLLRAVGLAFVVPVTSQIIRWSIPRIEHDERSTFLLYETLFFAFAAAIEVLLVPRARNPRLARRATRFVLVQYATWIVADIGLALTDRDGFYLVRLVANLLYYVVFVPFMMKLLERAESR